MEVTAFAMGWLTLGLVLVFSGAVAGFLAGLFGIGGGAILVPVLYQFLGILDISDNVSMHVAVGSSLAIIAPTSIRSFLSHKAKGAVDMDLLKSWLIAVPIGVIIGSATAAFVSGSELRVIFALIAFIVSLRLLWGRDDWRLANDLPGNPLRAFIGIMIGFFSTLMGIGGGVFNNSFMTLCNRPIHQAIATSAGTGALIAIPGMVGFIIAGWGVPDLPPLSLGYVNMLAIALVIPVSIFAAPYGAHFAHKLSRQTLERAFGIFLLIVALRFVISVI